MFGLEVGNKAIVEVLGNIEHSVIFCLRTALSNPEDDCERGFATRRTDEVEGDVAEVEGHEVLSLEACDADGGLECIKDCWAVVFGVDVEDFGFHRGYSCSVSVVGSRGRERGGSMRLKERSLTRTLRLLLKKETLESRMEISTKS